MIAVLSNSSLIKDDRNKIFLIRDNLRVHNSKPVKARLSDHSNQIEIFYPPSYSPELNPDERLNADLKHAAQRSPTAPRPNSNQLQRPT